MKKKDILKEINGIWKDKIKSSGVEYVKEIRKGWEKRAKRLGI